MTIYQSSARYQVTDSKKEAVRKPQEEVPYTLYTSVEGDTFDSLAFALFGDALRYWEIADINPHVKFPGLIKTGTILRVPR
jgi:nucleoid-associated protein YgaU